MGQIVGLKSKPKRCNLNALGSVPTPAAGEYILVSYDNSMTANGQGNFDRYIIGDGRTAATALELKYLDDSTRPYIVEEVNKAVADIQPIEITGDVTNAPDEEDLTSEKQGNTDVLKFKDKAYNAALYSGLGRVYLRKNIVTLEGTGKNVLTQAMVNTTNTIYHIQYDYDINGQTINLPAGCVLEFDGGSIKNGTLNLADTSIKADRVIFGDNLTITGKCLQVASPEWFAGTDADKIEKAIDVFSVVQLAARNYNISRTIVVNHSFALYGYGIPDFFGKNYTQENNEECSQTILFSSVGADNSVIRIDGPTRPYVSFVIEGVSFYGDRLSDAICINTAGGPSRPALISKCNIRNFNRGIYIAKRSSATTNVGFIEIANNNITGNSYAIYSTGRSTIMHADINNNNLEQNTINHIYLSSETSEVTDAPLNGNLIIENNLLEGGSKYPVKIKSLLSCVDFKNNYFEGSQSPYYVDIICSSNFGVLNVGSNHTANAIVIFKVNGNVNVSPMARGDYLEFAGYILSATNNLKLSVNSDANNKVHDVSAPYDSNVDKYPSEPLLKTTFNKQYQFNGFYAAKVENNEVVQQTLSGITLSAGYYTIACVVKHTGTQYYNAAGPTIDIRDMLNNVSLFGGQARFMYFKNIVIYTGQFYIEEETTGNLRIRVLGKNEVATFFSDVFIYEGRFASIMLPHIDSAHCGTLPPILTSDDKGFVFYNKSIGKSITWNGEEWKDENGFTPARAKGTTAQRPTNLSPSDNGYQYYDTDVIKPIFASFSVGTTLISQVVSGQNDIHISNTCVNGTWYNLTTTAHGGYRVKVIFRKAEGQTEDEITILTSSSTTDNINFKAPDPTIYPYIYIYNGRPSGANVTYKINNINTTWVDATGTNV